MPSGINPTLGCSPLTGCTEKDYYLPGRGVWAPRGSNSITKAKLGAIGGTIVGAALASGNDPLTTAAFAVGGLVIGHEVGATLDKLDEIHANMMLQKSLHQNANGQTSSWTNPDTQTTVTHTPKTTNGNCREFETTLNVKGNQEIMRGVACQKNGDWYLKEVY
tara:strand:+ start:5910 stop:6398 length:489 start_codon:yes stop_codon:yes gene_type:complete